VLPGVAFDGNTERAGLRGAAAALWYMLALFVAVVVVGKADAQCQGQWLQRYAPGVPFTSSNCIPAVCVLHNGDMVIGGVFNTSSSPPAHNVARWNGLTWAPLGAGLPGGTAARSLAVLPNGDLIAGLFSPLGSPLTTNVMRWDGSSWSALGSSAGYGDPVRALLVMPNGDLLAAAGPQVARWNGTSWSNVGPYFSDAVEALAVMPNGDIIAAGQFLGVPGSGVNLFGIGRWNGTAWSAMGGGFGDGRVHALAVLPNGDLVAAGFFPHGPAGVAIWTGGPWWHAIGTGLNSGSEPWSLAVSSDGSLIVAGQVNSAGGAPVDGVARWDGTNWSSVGRRLNVGVLEALALAGGDLLVTGYPGGTAPVTRWALPTADFNHDGVFGDAADIEALFHCLAGGCCATCGSADFDGDGDAATDADIEAFFRVLAGGSC
jgi:hypothetical protein